MSKLYRGEQVTNFVIGERHVIDTRSPISLVCVNSDFLPSKMIAFSPKTKYRTYAWGYNGVYPLNLAVSLICDFLDIDNYREIYDLPKAKYVLSDFYNRFIMNCKDRTWRITEDQLGDYINKVLETERTGNV